MTRPNVRNPIPAQNDDYTLGSGDPWDALPTKVDPGTFYNTQGFVPGADNRPAAQHVNFFVNAWSRWIDYLRFVPIRNWTERAFDTDSIESVCFIPTTRRWLIGRRNGLVEVSHDSLIRFDQTALSTGGGQVDYVRFMTSNGANKALFVVADVPATNTDADVWLYDAGVFTRQALAPFNVGFEQNGLVYVSTSTRWIAFGGIGGTPRTYRSDDDGATWTLVNTVTGAPSSAEVLSMAYKAGNVLIGIGPRAAGGTDIWISTNSGTTYTESLNKLDSLGNSIGTNPDGGRYIAYSSLSDTWMIATGNGDTYTSVDDGTTWVKRTTAASGSMQGIACDGGTFFLLIDRGSNLHEVQYSDDNGVTWTTCASLPSAAVTAVPGGSSGVGGFDALRFEGGRLMALFSDDTDGLLCYSLGT